MSRARSALVDPTRSSPSVQRPVTPGANRVVIKYLPLLTTSATILGADRTFSHQFADSCDG